MEPYKVTKTVESTFYGGTGGHPFDDGIIFNGVRTITFHSGDFIDSIQVVYDRDGYHVRADKHGGDGGTIQSIELDYPREFITKVSGLFDQVSCEEGTPVVIQSLQLQTTLRTIEIGRFQPDSNATPFTFTVPDGKIIIGIFGRSGQYLDAIGFHVTDPKTVIRT